MISTKTFDRPSVSVVGLGYVGSCISAALAAQGLRVTAVDIDFQLVQEMNSGVCRFSEEGLPQLLAKGIDRESFRATTDYGSIENSDVVVVAVGTPIQEGGYLHENQLIGASNELSKHLRPGQLVIFKSTVPPGTTRDRVLPVLEKGGLTCGKDFNLSFSPERLSEGSALKEMEALPIVVGGWSEECSAAAEHFWQQGLGARTIKCSSLETAEMVKMADNWWIDHNIALANELAKVCSSYGIDVMEVISAANSMKKGNGNVNILLPSIGVGGSCLTKDPWLLWRAAKERGVDLTNIPTVRDVNDGMPDYTVDLIYSELARLGKLPEQAKVALLGLAFKNNTGDLRETPVRHIVSGLRAAGSKVKIYDPLTDPEEVHRLFGIRISSSLEEAVSGADCIAILALHREFEEIDFEKVRGRVAEECLLLDGRAYYTAKKIQGLQKIGFVYRGIGRGEK